MSQSTGGPKDSGPTTFRDEQTSAGLVAHSSLVRWCIDSGSVMVRYLETFYRHRLLVAAFMFLGLGDRTHGGSTRLSALVVLVTTLTVAFFGLGR